MIRLLQIVNLLGVATLAVLCAAQWRVNSRLDQEARRLDATRIEQLTKISEQEARLKADAADLEQLRAQLIKDDDALKSADSKITTLSAERNRLESDRNQLAADRDQLKAALGKWIAAVAERDDAIKRAGGQIQKLAGERNDAVAKFNELATKYNAVVKELAPPEAKH